MGMFLSFEEWLDHLIPDYTWPLTPYGTSVVVGALMLIVLLVWAVF